MSHGRVGSHENLRVWLEAMNLAEDVYRITLSMPQEERFVLISQLRRAAVSIPANIAEGAGRSSERDFMRFLSIARGSLSELETHLLLSHRLGLIDLADQTRVRVKIVRIMLTRLMRALKAKIGRQELVVTSSPRHSVT